MIDIVIADSHPEMLAGVRRLLENRFGPVLMVADEMSLMDALDKIRPGLLIVDLSLPVADGVNVVPAVKRRHPGLPVIVLSVHDEPEVASEVLSAGAAGFVLKRTAATELLPAVEAVLAGRNYVSELGEKRGEVN
ncbi:MAG: response regulator transcription factor [Vicinamibacteria bacterium]